MPLSSDRDQLVALLHRAAEAPELDYKSTWDPSQRKDLLEVCKDIAALESLPSGGHIVVGAKDDGTPSETFTPADPRDFDEQKLRSKVARELGEPLDFGAGLHELDGHYYLVIAVGPHQDGIRIMPRDGEHADGTVWREADVFVRRGTSSIRWNHHEARGIFERIVAGRKEQWRADVFDTLRRSSPVFEQGGYVNVTADMPIDAFVGAVTELIRRSDRVGLDVLIRRSIKACVEATERAREARGDDLAGGAELDQLLDRLDVIASLAARYGDGRAFSQVLGGYRAVYAANDEEMLSYPSVFKAGHRLVLVHAFALGAVLVNAFNWPEVGELSRLAPVHTHGGYHRR